MNSYPVIMDIEKLLYIFEHNKNIGFRKSYNDVIKIFYYNPTEPSYSINDSSSYIEKTEVEIFTIILDNENKLHICSGMACHTIDDGELLFNKIHNILVENKSKNTGQEYITQLIENLYRESNY